MVIVIEENNLMYIYPYDIDRTDPEIQSYFVKIDDMQVLLSTTDTGYNTNEFLYKRIKVQAKGRIYVNDYSNGHFNDYTADSITKTIEKLLRYDSSLKYVEKEFIMFGKYPNIREYNPILIDELKKINNVNDKGYIEYNDKYYKEYLTLFEQSYYEVQDIVWEVLYHDDNEMLLITYNIIDYLPYNNDIHNLVVDGEEIDESVYFYSDIRSYLNKEFFKVAFSYKEKAVIRNMLNSTAVNEKVSLLNVELLDCLQNYVLAYPTNYVCDKSSLKEAKYFLKGSTVRNNEVEVVKSTEKQFVDSTSLCGVRPIIKIKTN